MSIIYSYHIRRTKQKTIYVVSTYKRPVPLKHFLYTGNSKQTSDQLFEIVGVNKRFNTPGLVWFSASNLYGQPCNINLGIALL